MSPILSIFYGVTVKLFYEENSRHNIPHIHAYYQDFSVSMDLEGNILEGNLPKNKLKLLVAWVEIHKEDLEANWKAYHSEGTYFRIKPLD